MAKIPEVSREVWSGLYSAMTRFGNLKPWEFFDDSHVFGVKDPSGKEMGYACIMGALGEVLALGLYRGSEGFEAHRRMQKIRNPAKSGDLFASLNCLMAEFTGREDLQKADLSVTWSLGLKFRGLKSWPFFRSYLPGHAPWYLTESEAIFLTFALRCACDLAAKVKAGALNLEEKPGQALCYYRETAGQATEFETRWEPLPIHRPEPLPPFELDKARIDRLLTKSKRVDDIWEAGVSFLPAPVMDRDRPYLPRMVLVAHQDSGFIINSNLIESDLPPHQALGEGILNAIEEGDRTPAEIHLSEENLAASLSPLGKILGIRIKGGQRLKEVSRARRELEKSMPLRGMSGNPSVLETDKKKTSVHKDQSPVKIPDPRAIEGLLFDLEGSLQEQDFKSDEELDKWLKKVTQPQAIKKFSPKKALDVAQRVMYEAWDEEDPDRRQDLAEKALKIFPDCTDAYNLLAEEAGSSEDALRLYQKGVEAGERALGSAYFKENTGHFWGLIETRPYMRARGGLAQCLWSLGKREDAVKQYYEMLKLNPNDNQGNRYQLLGCLGELGRFEEIWNFINSNYEDDCAAEWLYTKALAAFVREGASPLASSILKEAWEENKFAPDYLLGRKRIPFDLPDHITMGGEDEGLCYASNFQDSWKKAPGAFKWLGDEIGKLVPPKVGRNDACPCGSGKKFKKCCMD